MSREQALLTFLNRAGWGDASRHPIPGDASFRRYERLVRGDRCAILMDAPPPREDVRPFLAILGQLRRFGFSAPAALSCAIDDGFLLLEDLGDQSFNQVIQARADLETPLYEAAVDLLVDLHNRPVAARLPVADQVPDHSVPPYDAALLMREVTLLTDWYLPAFFPDLPDVQKAVNDWKALWRTLFRRLDSRNPVLVLRDYHADNLMWLPHRNGLARVGLLDFQDAVHGHRAYDLVSLLQDARRDVPPPLEAAMIARYLAGQRLRGTSLDEAAFRRDYAILGAQRAAKIIGIFTRLSKRDGKDRYLAFLPRMWGLLERNLAAHDCDALEAWLDRTIPESTRSRTRLNG
ncbi:aminoglycoside phosphotransferase [Iodidimonas gelatinilytica]|uniref:Aminoglycoside phosphotransferase n=1 Tax=Iodidimonas gelatinilytica TaxID=1236966 RepID=A0A5A7MY85_9PROT|nr:phosphotransferase [Iodidimonas gelatinilytica]GER00952.1 aminoglycoside phosphotransferase [Iodidimonas gelatinilytica]